MESNHWPPLTGLLDRAERALAESERITDVCAPPASSRWDAALKNLGN